MKSKSFTVYVVLALAALALWFVRPTGRISEPGQATPQTVAAPTPLTPYAEPNTARGTSPPNVAIGPVGGTPRPAASVVTTSGPLATQSAVAANSPLKASESSLLPNQTAQIDVGRVRHMVSDYHTLMGENPVGTNAEIMKQMMGGNSHQATLGPPEGMALNSQGELIDQWGTPFFFHQLSADKMEVRSAGPDKIMWTTDDVITR